MPIFSTEAIILKQKNTGEHDRIFSVYSSGYGKLRLLAKGARKIKSKLAGSLKPFYLVRLEFVRGRNLDRVTASRIINPYRKIYADLGKIAAANLMVALADSLIYERKRDPRIFNLLKDNLLELERSQVEAINLLKLYFVWHLFSYLGLEPRLFNCVYCNQKIKPDNNYFSSRFEGILCDRCKNMDDQDFAISNEAIKILRFLNNSYLKVKKLKLEIPLQNELDKITNDFICYHLNRELPAAKFLQLVK